MLVAAIFLAGLVSGIMNAVIELNSQQLCASVMTVEDEIVEDPASFSLMLEPSMANGRLNIEPPATVTVMDDDSE